MTDKNSGKSYAVKCFIKDQPRREESYRKIADELEGVNSPYLVTLQYLDNELFVDTTQCDREEFPVVVMEWIEGENLDVYLKRHLNDKSVLANLSGNFNLMAAWLLNCPFAHGDLKPDNILVKKDGALVLVDYDGMFVPAMKDETAREIGTPDYRHPLRTYADFNKHIDDFPIIIIALSLKALAINPKLKNKIQKDTLLLSETDFRDSANSGLLKDITLLSSDSDIKLLLGIFYLSLDGSDLNLSSFRIFKSDEYMQNTGQINSKNYSKADLKPKRSISKGKKPLVIEKIETGVSKEEIASGVKDRHGVVYSKDGSRLLKCENSDLEEYVVIEGTELICDEAFSWCRRLKNVYMPSTLEAIGNKAFQWDYSLSRVLLPSSVKYIGESAFSQCDWLQWIGLPSTLTSLSNSTFSGCYHLPSIILPSSLVSIGDDVFRACGELKTIRIPETTEYIGYNPFLFCKNLKINLACKDFYQIVDDILISNEGKVISCLNNKANITLPSWVTSIGENAFQRCESLQCINIPYGVTAIGKGAFEDCKELQNVSLPSTLIYIGDNAFMRCESLCSIDIPQGVTLIRDGTFFSCKSLKTISIPSSLIYIGDNAFGWCSALQELKIPSSVTSMHRLSIHDCHSLRNVQIPGRLMMCLIEDAFPENCAVLLAYD